MQSQSWVYLSLCLLSAAIGVFAASGQSGVSSAISGTVEDATGAVLPGAIVTLTYAQTGAQRRTTAGADGGFLFLELSAGDYRVSAEARGFEGKSELVTYQGIPIRMNVRLAAAGATTEVLVNASSDGPRSRRM